MKLPPLPKFAGRRPLWAVAVAALITGSAAAWYHLQGSQAVSAEAPASKVAANRLTLPADASQLAFLKIEAASQVAIPASEPMNARVALADDFTARVFPPIAGRVISLTVQPGDTVAAGAPLAIIDAPDFGQAVADLRRAEAVAVQKSRDLSRAHTLFDGEVLSKRDLEAVEADAAAAKAEGERARLRLANLAPTGGRIDGERLALRAPLAGVVVDRQANPGTEVRPDAPNPLFVISNLKRLWLLVDLPERAAALAKVGAPVHFSVEAWPGVDFVATVERVGEAVDATTRRIPVRAVIDNTDGRLKPEMYARATLSEKDAPSVIRVPVGALLTGGLSAALFVQTGPGEFERRPVNVYRQDAEYAYLAPDAPVRPGDKVVTRGALLLASEMAQAE